MTKAKTGKLLPFPVDDTDGKEAWGPCRPKHYEECENRPRPCPWVGCKWHLLLDVNPENGSMIFNLGREGGRNSSERRLPMVGTKDRARFIRNEEKLFSVLEKAVEQGGPKTCLLDVVRCETTYTLEEVGQMFSLTRERVRQIEMKALLLLRKRHPQTALSGWTEDTRKVK